jgi:NAD(P)-dependent dehydrogenase (short-subunit alcohol dehydrogenase family)
VAHHAVRIMRAQGTGGVLLFNTSKQAVNPGTDFGPYGLPKAATLFLVRQYALDHGRDGIRANAVNADRIRSGLLTDEMVAARAKARGVSETDYMAGSFECECREYGRGFCFPALAENDRRRAHRGWQQPRPRCADGLTANPFIRKLKRPVKENPKLAPLPVHVVTV